MQGYDAVQLAVECMEKVSRGDARKYYRVARPGRWYGGIATADCVGCNLKCVFCWSDKPRDYPDKVGAFHTSDEIFNALDRCARKFHYKQLRVSGNEPTLSRCHLLKLLERIEESDYQFILETNGILIGNDQNYARDLSRFRRIHVRVSVKGTNEQEFSRLTGASQEGFRLQLNALRNLVDHGVTCHAAVMLSFTIKNGLQHFKATLQTIDRRLARNIEEEYVFLYPHVGRRLKSAGVKPMVSFEPNRVPSSLV